MGTHIFETTSSTRLVRAYAHCHPAQNGTVSVAYLNLDKSAASVQFHVQTMEASLSVESALLYSLVADDLVSETVKLNGRALAFDQDNRAPDLSGGPVTGAITLPAASFGFVQLGDDATVAACKSRAV
jgi:hypothetical protein